MSLLTDRLRRELSCPLCLNLYTDPILLRCDHNFCRACIFGAQPSPVGNLRCPKCQTVVHSRDCRKNQSLANFVVSFKQANGDRHHYCDDHRERLQLFCEEEQKAICLVCTTSEDHRDHRHVPITEALKEYKKKLEDSRRALQQKEKEAKGCFRMETEEIKEVKERKKYLKMKIREEFGKLQDFLQKEGKKLNEELERMEEHYVKILEDKKENISNQISQLENAASEVEKTLDQTEPELLKDINVTLNRAEVQFINPERPSVDLCEEEFIGPFQYKVWKRMKDSIIPVLESLTIDPDTAHKQLIVSRDQSNIKYGLAQQDLPDGPKRFENSFAALSSKGFKSGKHYWEVEVEGKAFWVLGVAKHSVERKRPLTSPLQDGLWTLCLKNKSIYAASSTPAEPLSLEKTPTRIGVYLNYEGGKVSFYNADDLSHIYTYTNKFTEEMYPYFNLYCSDVDDEDDIPLKIFPL
ncbi:zinc-binding protein A33-like isoform X1 [Latimeria chalumnae]|uniref:zinc-binding protein A33-like isoform X1 n=1 Tax=Latimeria chalumnae TaxID=7897 RepID=UPI0006D8E58F|nr:PREDICTED: zinc-binding protein A33-like isoform X1 [Latimeria chalumnae]|eukprot:XP_014353688.1 PREDICTED: zinc-binding protein A33-like isoform X1 [Latimeria chalumnae]